MKFKYTSSISFTEAREIVESYTYAPGLSYASITKSAGASVSCVDAATQKVPVLITATQSWFYNIASSEASADLQPDTSEKLTINQRKKIGKAYKKLQQIIGDTLVEPKKNLSKDIGP